MVTLTIIFTETEDGGVNAHWQRDEQEATDIETKASIAVIGLIQMFMNYGPPRKTNVESDDSIGDS